MAFWGVIRINLGNVRGVLNDFGRDLELACLNVVHDDLDAHPVVEPAADTTSDETANRGAAPACSEGGSEVVSMKAEQQAHLGQELDAAAVSENLKDVRVVPEVASDIGQESDHVKVSGMVYVGGVAGCGDWGDGDLWLEQRAHLAKWKARMASRMTSSSEAGSRP